MEYTGERIILEAPECSPGTILFREHLERYKFASQYVKNKRVLDIACGVGYGTETLCKLGGPLKAIGGDISVEAIGYAKARYNSLKNATFSVMNAEKLPLEDKSIDVIVSFETIEHLPNVTNYLDEVYRVLSPGGTFIVSTPNRDVTHIPNSVIENPFHFHEFTKDELLATLGKHYKEIQLFYQRKFQTSLVSSALGKVSRWRTIYRRIIPKFIREDLRNFVFPDISNDLRICPYREEINPLNYIAVCRKS